MTSGLSVYMCLPFILLLSYILAFFIYITLVFHSKMFTGNFVIFIRIFWLDLF